MSAAALARSSTLRSSSCVATPPPKFLEGSPATLTRSTTVLSYWLGVSRRAWSAGACGAVQSTGAPPAVAPPLLVPPAPGPAPDEPVPCPADALPGAPLLEPCTPPTCPWHAASATSATSEGKSALLEER